MTITKGRTGIKGRSGVDGRAGAGRPLRRRRRGIVRGAVAGLLLLGVLAGGVFVLRGVATGGLTARVAAAATRTLGSAVTVGAVRQDRKTGLLTLDDVRVANPAGFQQPYIVTIAQVRLNAPAGGLAFTEVGVSGLVVTLEVLPGGTNLAAWRRGFDPAAMAADRDRDGKPLLTTVRRVEMADARLEPARLAAGAAGPAITLPDMVLRGIGEKQGTPLSAALAAVADHAVRVAAQAAGQAGFYDGMTPQAVQAMRDEMDLSAGIAGGFATGAGAVMEHAVDTVKRDLREFGAGVKKLLQEGPPQDAPPPAR